jgi:hypothetical protein
VLSVSVAMLPIDHFKHRISMSIWIEAGNSQG